MKKYVQDGYILAVTDGDGLTVAEEAEIKTALANAPAYQDGYKRMLRDDTKTWDILPVRTVSEILYTQESLEAMTNAALEQILSGFGITASMNKANMIRLILQAQGDETA